MANRLTRSPGAVRKFDAAGRISDTMSTVVEGGQAFAALEQLGGSLNKRLRALADSAAEREGELAGLTAGQRAGAGFLEQRQAEGDAYARASGIPADIGAIIDSAAAKYGQDPNALRMVAALESNGDPRAQNPSSSAGGLFQFIDATASDYGLADRFDPIQAADAAARLMRDNSAALTKVLGRAPTPAELYLAHQQGGGGAAMLLGNPGAKAADLVGLDAVIQNGGSADMTAGAFAGLWLKKAGGSDVVLPSAPPVPYGLDATPLQLRNDGTIRGAAFDKAAINAYGWRMQTGLSTQLASAYEEFKDDPQGYETAIGQIHDSLVQDSTLTDPRMREIFDRGFSERVASDRLQIAARGEARAIELQRVAMDEGLSAMSVDIERQAYNLGANPAGDAILEVNLARARNTIGRALADNLLTPAQAAAQLDAVAASVARGKVTGVFDALSTPAEQRAFATSLLTEWAAGTGPLAGRSLTEVQALSNTLLNKAIEAESKATAAGKAEKGRLATLMGDDVASIAATGQPLDPLKSGLTPMKVGAMLGPETLAEWSAARELATKTYQATAGMELDSPQEIADRLAALTPAPGQPGYADQLAIATEAKKKAAAILEERTTDPLGQAHRAGLVTLAPFDFSNPEALGQTLVQRRAAASVVAAAYGTPVTIFRPSERKAMIDGLISNPDLLAGFAMSVSTVFGDQAPKALAELSEAGPEIAFAAGIALANGDTSIAADIGRVLKARQDKTYKLKMPTDNVFAGVAGQLVGDAFAGNPAASAAVLGTAQLLFEQEANALGLDVGDLSKPDSAAFAAFERAIDRALGARLIDGVQFGGRTMVNGSLTIAPADMPADRTQQLMWELTDSQMIALPPIGSTNGVPVRAQDLRGGHLVAVGNGLYRVAMGDPTGLDPQFVTTPAGDYWILDLNLLNTLNRLDTDPTSQGGFQLPASGFLGGGF